jgi:integrase
MAKKRRKLFKKPHSNNWHCQFGYRTKDGLRRTYRKSLGTPDKETAWVHYREIEKKLDDLKNGLKFTWSWERNSQFTEIKVQTVADAFKKYVRSAESRGLKADTIQGSRDAYRRMMESKCASPTLPIKSLSVIDLEKFKIYWSGKHAPNTINQSLNKIKAFLNYCVDKKWMGAYKSIHSPVKSKPISYFTDEEFDNLMGAMANDELRRAMLFYRETGCRKREPFISKRVGNTLIIPPMKGNPEERKIVLPDILCPVHNEMVTRFKERLNNCKNERQAWDWWYYKLKESCKKVGLGHKTLHDLRDTYIVRLWAITGDIHLVSRMVGHSDIKQTVDYARFSPSELLVHFPTLEAWLKPRLIEANSLMDGTVLDGSTYGFFQITDGEGISEPN